MNAKIYYTQIEKIAKKRGIKRAQLAKALNVPENKYESKLDKGLTLNEFIKLCDAVSLEINLHGG